MTIIFFKLAVLLAGITCVLHACVGMVKSTDGDDSSAATSFSKAFACFAILMILLLLNKYDPIVQ